VILIKNTQKKIKIDQRKIKKVVQNILDILSYDDFDIGIWFTTNKTIHKFNKEFRKKDKPTDILSFAYHSNIKAGQLIKPKSEEDKNLGDLIISPEYVQKNTIKMDENFEDRLKMLLVHGICHLIGYDHEDDKDFTKMQKKEKEIMKKLTNS